jgi:hypothetical protein
MMADKYNILRKGTQIHSSLTEEEYFDAMEDLAQKYYENGFPEPYELTTEIIQED